MKCRTKKKLHSIELTTKVATGVVKPLKIPRFREGRGACRIPFCSYRYTAIELCSTFTLCTRKVLCRPLVPAPEESASALLFWSLEMTYSSFLSFVALLAQFFLVIRLPETPRICLFAATTAIFPAHRRSA